MAADYDGYLAVLKASYDYDPQSEDEIAMQENQVFFLLERTDDEWVFPFHRKTKKAHIC